MKTRWLSRVPLLTLAAMPFVAIFAWYWFTRSLDGIPEPGQVRAMKAVLDASDESPERLLFDVPHEHITPILEALRPRAVDPRPAKWVVLGELHMDCEGERHYGVYLYLTGHDEGAFSAGQTRERRVYYRGGTDQRIQDALRNAYQASLHID